MSNIATSYKESVIGDGDSASAFFKKVCAAANKITSVYPMFHNKGWYVLKSGLDCKDEIDGVGTKTEIYGAAFEAYFQEYVSGNISKKDAIEKATDIWERMFADLAAMNLDDLRNGEMWVSLTNIMEINHTWNDPEKKEIFVTSIGQSMENTIKELQIMFTAWETAIVWNGRINARIVNGSEELMNNIEGILSGLPSSENKEKILWLINGHRAEIKVTLWEIEFRGMWGTEKGVMMPETNKFVGLKSDQPIAAIQEISKDGIIWPRSNWISAIRGYMIQVAGPGWETMSFEEFLEVISQEKAWRLSERVMKTCAWKQMWEIATGKTTVFNPFVSRKLLWGKDNEPIANISSIIHVTWNPWKKIADALPGVWVNLDISKMLKPQIIEILQVTADLSDEQAMNHCGWNMWVPFATVFETEEDMNIAIEKAKEEWYEIIPIWKTTDETEWRRIKWVWIGNSTIEIPLAA